MRIYISIPITGRDIDTQRAKAAEIADKIRAAGHEPVNPFDTPYPARKMPEKELYAYFMGEDIKKLLLCDAVLLCQGWGESKGCRIERAVAIAAGMGILDPNPQSESLRSAICQLKCIVEKLY